MRLTAIAGAARMGTVWTSCVATAGIARGAGAHTVANAQLGDGIGVGVEAFSVGTLPCSGIVQSWEGL